MLVNHNKKYISQLYFKALPLLKVNIGLSKKPEVLKLHLMNNTQSNNLTTRQRVI